MHATTGFFWLLIKRSMNIDVGNSTGRVERFTSSTSLLKIELNSLSSINQTNFRFVESKSHKFVLKSNWKSIFNRLTHSSTVGNWIWHNDNVMMERAQKLHYKSKKVELYIVVVEFFCREILVLPSLALTFYIFFSFFFRSYD